MKQGILKEWLAALRSGDYEQGNGYLRTSADEFCCLGVLCDLAHKAGVVSCEVSEDGADASYRYGGIHGLGDFLPQEVRGWAQLDDWDVIVDAPSTYGHGRTTVSKMNDNDSSFADIADALEKELTK